MTLQRMKTLLILLIVISVFGGICFFMFYMYYKPILEKNINKRINDNLKFVPVVVASDNIIAGTVIQGNLLETKMIPTNNLVDPSLANLVKSPGDAVGKVANYNIYKNEQVLIERLRDVETKDIRPSDKLITVEIPKYNFVNGKVNKGSLVDILVDKGQGKYDVVLSKVYIYDKTDIQSSKSSGGSGGSSSDQVKRPPPKPILSDAGSYNNAVGNVTAPQLLRQNNPALTDTPDYLVTLKVTEKEQKSLLEAMTWGKLATRLYIDPKQPASRVTFVSPEASKVVGDGTFTQPVTQPKQNKTPVVANP